MENENKKEIREVGSVFTNSNELAEGSYNLSFMTRCKEVSKVDNDDRAIYGDRNNKTVLAASQLVRPYAIGKGDEFPPTVSFDVDAKHRISFKKEVE